MFSVWREKEISSAHALRGYKGKCEATHGHNWRIRAVVAGDALDNCGILLDFAEIDSALGKICSRLDHIVLNEISPFDKENPSAENIAKYVFDEISATLNCERYRVSEVLVWENEKSCASYKK